MQKNIFSRIRLASFGKVLKYRPNWSAQRAKLSWGLGAGLFLASSSKFILNNFNAIAKSETQEEADFLPEGFQAPVLEEFNDENYKKAIENKFDILIVCNFGEAMNDSMDQIKVLLFYLQEAKKGKGRQLKLFEFKPKDAKDIQQFQEKYGVKINQDTMFLLKNKYSPKLLPVSTRVALYNFEQVFDYFQKVKKIGSANFDKFSSYIKNMPSTSLLVVAYLPKSPQKSQNQVAQFADLKSDRSLGRTRFKNIDFVAVSDEQTAKSLGLDTSKEGKLYLLSKTTKYNQRARTLTLKDTNLHIIPMAGDLNTSKDALLAEMSLLCKNYFIFEFPNFYQFPSRYSVILKVDKNKIEKREYNQCVDAFAKLHHKLRTDEKALFKDIKLLKTNDKLAEDSYKILVVDMEAREKDAEFFENTEPLTPEKRKELENQKPRSFVYRFPKDRPLDEVNLLNFIKEVQQNKVPEYFLSQPEPKSQKFSTKIVKSNFKKEILDKDKDHALFFHSAHCHACKQYGPHYEKFALENLQNPESKVQFNRMDSDHNQIENFVYFYHTPIFMVIRKEEKSKPFIYSSPYFTPDLLKNFIYITTSQQLISREVEKNIFKNAEANRKLVEGLKFEEAQ